MAEKFVAADGGTDDREARTPEWYGDCAYGTGDLRGAIHDAGHDAVIKPRAIPAAVAGGFTRLGGQTITAVRARCRRNSS